MNKKTFLHTGVARFVAGAVTLMALPGLASASADDVASLYGPQPPANATYLRVLNTSAQSAKVALSGSVTAQTLAPGEVTRFSVVQQGTPLRVAIDGTALSVDGSATAATASDDALTIALAHDTKGWHATRISGKYGRVDGLKATLHAFNFAPGCTAKISLGGDGPTVFDQIHAGTQISRAINPVSATLVGQCGAAKSAPLTLPPLAAGDSYSLFMTGDAAKPELVGVRDTLAWPPAAH